MKEISRKLWLKFKLKHDEFKAQNHPPMTLVRYGLAGFLGFMLFLFLLLMVIVLPGLPDIDNIEKLVAPQSSQILDRDGKVLYAIHGDENRSSVPLNKISPYAVKATLAIEDDKFYEHGGVDFKAFLVAVCGELHICNTARGGSTITQQYIKNAFLSSERTYTRKFKEIVLALQLEEKYTKDEILEFYLNRIPYGSNLFGVEVAAQTFFGVPASDLSLAQSAILASIPKAPTYYSPYGSNKYAIINLSEEEILKEKITSEQELVNISEDTISKGLLGKTYEFGDPEKPVKIYIQGRVDFVLGRMVELGDISEDEAAAALEEAKNMEFAQYKEDIKAPHFVLYVKQLLEDKYGKEQIEKGGLKITTTLNGAYQEVAEKTVAAYAERNATVFGATNAALVTLDPDTGEILAMIGSTDYWNDDIDGKVNIALRPRLPGSSFKPIVYAAAFLQGYAPSSVLYDVDTKFGSWYQPKNYDGTFLGPMTMRNALGGSRNIPAVKAGYLAGIPNVLDLARKMGIQLNQGNDWYGLSLALGAGEARPIDMAAAYGTFANGGYKVDPVAILKVEDRNGNILEEYEPPKKRTLILDPQVAFLINDILSDPTSRPADYWNMQLTIPGQIAAAKTGTSNKEENNITYPFDTWTNGYTRHLVTAVWTGNANGEKQFAKADGLSTAAPIWRDYMTEITKDAPRAPFEKPEGIKYVKISKRSGKLPSEYTPEEDIVTGIFASFATPREYDDLYQMVDIDQASGLLATEFTPPEAIEKKAFFTHHSEQPDNPSWEEPVRKWAEENHEDELPPTEYDNVHTAETLDEKPEIRIISPKTTATVAPPQLGVWVNITSPAGVAKVDYYWDDELASTAEKSPYKGNISIPTDAEGGSEHVIKAVVFDSLYRSAQSSISVKIGKDDINPNVSFVYPGDEDTFSAGSSMAAQVDAKDPNGDILKVEFYMDGVNTTSVRIPPYVWQFTVPESLGTHDLEAVAYDHAGNQSKTKITINSKSGSSSDLTGDSRIVEPSANKSFGEGERILIRTYLSDEDQADIESLTIYSKKADDTQKEIATATGGAPSYTFIWDSPPSGRYEIFMKIVLSDGRIRFSQRNAIVIR